MCCLCAPLGQESNSYKAEPVQSPVWHGDAASTPMDMDSESHSPSHAFLPAEDSDPSINVPVVKLDPPLKGNLRKPSSRISFVQDNIESPNDNVDNGERQSIERRSIKWLDDYGKKLIEVKEFEPSDSEESDNEDEELFSSCTCSIQ